MSTDAEIIVLRKAVLQGIGVSRANSCFVAEAVNTDEEMDKAISIRPVDGQALRERSVIKAGKVLYLAEKQRLLI